MNRNQKIALGCGGAGCLGLIVVVIAGLAIYFLANTSPGRNRNRNSNFNVSTNRNSNTNDNSDFNSNANDNSSNSNSSSTSAASLSEDDKHKLYQAAGMTGDAATIRDVSIKLGLLGEDYMPRENYQSFIYDHIEWAQRNTDFINSINTAEKARAYIDANLPD